jgi:hypothetical protein
MAGNQDRGPGIDHPLHQSIGKLINSYSIPESTILKDTACDPDQKQHITLFREANSNHVRFCDVDLLIAIDGEAKVIMEIEESNVKPVQVFGKFFASAFSSHYKPKAGDEFFPLGNSMLFIQVLDTSALNRAETGKLEQWKLIEEAIRGYKGSFGSRDMRYRLSVGNYDDYGLDSARGKELVGLIRSFLAEPR